MIIEKNREKINLFGAASTSICLIAAVYCLLNPTAGKRRESAFVFPDRVPLKSWQTIYTQPLSPRRTDISHKTDISDETDIPHEEERLNSGKLYSYRQNGTPLEIEMRYLAGTRGDIVTLINKHTNIPKQVVENTDIEKIPEVGYYILFSNRDRAYLSACINSRGNTTVTAKQFSQNRYSQDLKFNIVLPWLQGKDSLRDSRCLWVQLSTPLEKSTTSIAYQTLTKAWIDWYHWWQPRFPTL